MSSTSLHNDKNIWCKICGDMTEYSILENRIISWSTINKDNTGICDECAKALVEINQKQPKTNTNSIQ